MNGNAKVNALSQQLIKAGLNVKPIRFPTVPKGKERVRICLHSHNTQQQVEQLIQIVQAWIKDDSSVEATLTPVPIFTSTTPPPSSIASRDSNTSLISSSPTLSVSALSAKAVSPFPAKL